MDPIHISLFVLFEKDKCLHVPKHISAFGASKTDESDPDKPTLPGGEGDGDTGNPIEHINPEPTPDQFSSKNKEMATYRPYITQIYPTTFDPDCHNAAILASENRLEPNGRPILVIFNPRTNEILERQRYTSPLLLNLNQPRVEEMRILNDFQMLVMIPKQQRDMLMDVQT